MMHTLWLPLIGLAVMAILAAAFSSKRGKGPSYSAPWPLQSKSPLTPNEQAMYSRLSEALPDHIVLAQVQLSSFVEVRPPAKRQDWHNRYHQMSADFVICDYKFALLAAVELDDATHARKKRIEADTKKEHILRSAGVPLIRWHHKQMPNGDSIREALLRAQSPEAHGSAQPPRREPASGTK